VLVQLADNPSDVIGLVEDLRHGRRIEAPEVASDGDLGFDFGIGSEFAHVMVVMDVSQAGGFLFSYDKLFGAKQLSDRDMKNVEAGKETTIDRSLRLLYVTCSRARESLALVLWAENPAEALEFSRHKGGWFASEEVVEIA
jgi:DNA helicase-2/ATP-dependent DNA helicase PcrA